jgi:hypothetical protein
MRVCKWAAVACVFAVGLSVLPAEGAILFSNGETRSDVIISDGNGEMVTGDFLLNNGSLPTGSGRTVSGINIAGGWTVFQPFITDPEGWLVETVGVDGWLVTDPRGVGMLGTLYPSLDNGMPDVDNPLGSHRYFLGNDPRGSNWRDEPIPVVLDGDEQYWFASSSTDDDFWAAIFNAPQGMNSFSRRTNDGQDFQSGPTALRIAGELIPEPTTAALLGVGALMLLRRRR